MTRLNLLRSMDAQVRLDLVSPPTPPPLAAPLLVPPGRTSAALVTRAFGYLLRFEWQRRHPSASTHSWQSERAVTRFQHDTPDDDTATALMGSAKVAHGRFIVNPDPTPETRMVMATHAYVLARLDVLENVEGLAELKEPADPREAEDLIAMLDAVPWDAIAAEKVVLDPRFAPQQDMRAVAIADGRLLVVRTTKSARIDVDDIRALVLRLIHARSKREADATFPEVKELAIYSARQAHLTTFPVGPIVENEAFPQVEAWFRTEMRRIQSVEGRALARAAGGPDAPPPEGRKKPPTWARKRAASGPKSASSTDGKASVKKLRAAGGEPQAPPARTPQHQARKPDAYADEEAPAQPAAKKRKARLDWRRGSELQRRRGN